MATRPDDWYIEQALRLYAKPGVEASVAARPEPGVGEAVPGLYRDEKPTLSKGESPGAWVMLWAWIPDPPEMKSGKTDEGT